ncbi:MAG: GldG family protein, partial [Planctomycetes bacterium]|nr:GldG family protein [Planctomycetota bacterium]
SLDRRGSDPTARRRMKVTYVLMTAAFLLLLLQVAYLHIRGFWETATPIGPALSRIPALWATPLVLSLVCLGWSILTYRAARRAEMRNRRRVVKYATISETRVMGASRYYYEENVRTRRLRALAAVAALVIVLNLNWLAQYPFRTFSDSAWFSFLTAFQDRHWDVSWDKRNSLSPATIRALDGLQGRVTVYSFLPYDAEVREVPVGDELRRLLQRYGDYNSLVTVAFADPGREPELAEEMAAEIGLQPDEVAGMVVVNYQGRRNLISGSSLVAPPDWRAQAAGETLWVFDGENKLTQAVMRLSDPRVPQVYFTVGHRELSLTPGMHPDRSVSKFSRALESANMRVRTHLILASRPIPPECDILVIASPMSPFVEYEVEDVERFLAEGGRLLYLAPAASESFSFRTDAMEPLLRTLGGSIRDDLLRDSAVRPDDPHSYPKGKAAGTGDEALTFVFPMARTIRDNPLSIERGWSCERLVESLSSSFSMPFGGGVMRQGPFTMLYRSAKMMEAGEARAVVAACGLMASDSDIGRGENETLLVALTQWLAGREDPPIAPRTWTDRRLKLVGPQMRLILWIGVVALPLIWFLAGISVWWLRRE